MKRIIYTLIICTVGALSQTVSAQCGGSGQPPCNPGFFEIQLVQLNLQEIEIQMRAVNSVIPEQSSCSGSPATIQDNIVADLTFAVKWPAGAPVVGCGVETVTPCICSPPFGMGACSGGSGGYNISFGIGPLDGGDGTIIQGFAAANTPYGIPVDWMLNEWTPICTLTVFYEGDPEQVDIEMYGHGDNPMVELGAAISPNFNFDAVDYTMDVEMALPLDLLSFTAEKYGQRSVSLNWTTANEINTNHFSIERSEDAYHWQPIGKVIAKGANGGVSNYSFLDENVYDGRKQNARYYYRLNVIDNDGLQKKSGIDVVQFTSNVSGTAVHVFPNPSTTGVNVEINPGDGAASPTEIMVYNDLGQLVYRQEIPEGSVFEYIDYSKTQISAGAYTLQVLDALNGIIATEKLIVQR